MKEQKTKMSKTKTLVESALLVALSTVLGLFPLLQMPYGGSVTLAAMLPICIAAYRHGLLWGFGSGLVYGVVQQLLGLKNLSYFSTWQSILAVILLDYLLAFAAAGLGGIFRNNVKRQNAALSLGALTALTVRYVLHTVSGATVWAGLSIPTGAALIYSVIYNATYMIPETLVTVLAAYYLGSVLDFRRALPVRMAQGNGQSQKKADALFAAAWLLVTGAGVADVVLLAAHIQNAEDGTFAFAALAVPFLGSFWMAIAIVSSLALIGACVLLLIRQKILKKTA